MEWTKEIRETNIKIKMLLIQWQIPDLQADKIIYEVMKLNQLAITSAYKRGRKEGEKKGYGDAIAAEWGESTDD